MKHKFLKKVTASLAALLVFACNIAALAAPDCSAAGAVLMEADTGRVLFAQNPDAKMPMASTTKIMTAILAIENGDLTSTVTVSANAAHTEGSSIWLEVGEQMTLEDMLYGLMLSSGNDAAIAIAEHIAGSVEEFAAMMNAKAKELGANNTNFVTPNGLHDDNHYTTAYDLGLIACYAMQNETFRKIVSTEKKQISWEGHEYNRVVNNKNKILWQYEGGNGVKTGYTKKAGKCLVGGAERDGMQLISVVLNDPNMFPDSMSMLDYGFANYQNYQVISADDEVRIPVTGGVTGSVFAAPANDIYLPLSEDEYTILEKRTSYENELAAPVEIGAVVGKVEVLLNGEVVASEDIITLEGAEKNTIRYHLHKIAEQWLGF